MFRLRVWKKNTQVTEKEEKRRKSRNKLEKSRNDFVKASSLLNRCFANPESPNWEKQPWVTSVTSQRFSKCMGMVGMSTHHGAGILGC